MKIPPECRWVDWQSTEICCYIEMQLCMAKGYNKHFKKVGNALVAVP